MDGHNLNDDAMATIAMPSVGLNSSPKSVSTPDTVDMDLPVELLTHVFQNVLRDSRSDLLTCMQVNRRWHREAFSILYRNVSLRLREARRFSQAVHLKADLNDKGVHHFPHVRTLRVVIPGDGRDYG